MLRFCVCVALLPALLVGLARETMAADAPGDPTPVTPPAAAFFSTTGTSVVDRSIVLGAGEIEVQVPLIINASQDAFAKPFSVSPNIYYGVNNDLTVGITHTHGVLLGVPGAGSSLCLASDGCAKLYNNVGLDGIFMLSRRNGTQLAAHGTFDVSQIDPDLWTDLRVGVLGKYTSDIFALAFDPAIYVALSKRDQRGPYKQIIYVPVEGMVNVTPELNLFMSLGLIGPTTSFGDNYRGLLSFGAGYALSSATDVGAKLGFDNFWGKHGSSDIRTLLLFANFRL